MVDLYKKAEGVVNKMYPRLLFTGVKEGWSVINNSEKAQNKSEFYQERKP
ncbi:hypothetical protein N752_03990 [Desulforamulus aquiferis]|nr:hypothetical protein N752_03990 [Desulforamulus aquiferis]